MMFTFFLMLVAIDAQCLRPVSNSLGEREGVATWRYSNLSFCFHSLDGIIS